MLTNIPTIDTHTMAGDTKKAGAVCMFVSSNNPRNNSTRANTANRTAKTYKISSKTVVQGYEFVFNLI